jgi:hypothetical protein
LAFGKPVSGAVENNLPRLIGGRNVTEWRTENFFPIAFLTSQEHKAQRPFRALRRGSIDNFLTMM